MKMNVSKAECFNCSRGSNRGDDSDEELTGVGVGAGIRHADGIRPVVLDGLVESVNGSHC